MIFFSVVPPAQADMRMKDLARVGGWREMELVGYGLVTGLRGSGDKAGTNPSAASMSNLLNRLGLSLSPQDIASNNVAAVIVTARVSAFSRPGSSLDARVSSIGSATSLESGTLLLTPLRGADGQIYASAQGALASDPESGGNKRGANAVRSTTVVVPGGVLLEKTIPAPPAGIEGRLIVSLHTPDYVTAERAAQALRDAFKTKSRAVDAAMIEVEIPADFKEDPVGFAARVEMVRVGADERPRVVINEATGTVVSGREVKLSAVTISHAGLKIEVGVASDAGGTEGDVPTLVGLLNRVGAKPKDVVTIFKMIKRLGALKADLVVM
ncbi:MAG: flagellar basal body P-ring protein FlgI [Elusimicrobia bacterium]|nr:flagellar basal body P-ring protein FlgI [Elusimicrobiota bacterium]